MHYAFYINYVMCPISSSFSGRFPKDQACSLGLHLSISPKTKYLLSGDISVDTIKGIATKNNQDLFLSALEYRLLLKSIPPDGYEF